MIASLRRLALRALASLLLAGPCAAAPLNVTLSDPLVQPTFIGYTAVLPIRIAPTLTNGTVRNLEALIRPFGLVSYQLVDHTCPGSMTAIGSSRIEWTDLDDLVNGASIECEVELRPITHREAPLEVRLELDCTGCTGDADDRDSAFIQTELAPDVVATLSTPLFPPVGAASLTVVLVNRGDASALDTPVALFGTPALFSHMLAQGVGPCLNGYATTADSRTWTIPVLQPGQQIECPFSFNIPAAGTYGLSLAAPGQTAGGVPEPNLDDNYDNVSLTATSLVVNARFPYNADANPGDGVCDDGLGNCSLRAAVDEANALPGHQVISLPYRGDGYIISSQPGYLTFTDTATLSGVPDPVTGAYPFITRGGTQDVGLIRINTGRSNATILEYLDLRGDSDHELSVDGAVIKQSSGGLWVRNAKISGGWTTGAGGGIAGTEGLRLDGVEIFDNVADLGAGLAVFGVWNNGVVDALLEAVALHDNLARDSAGDGSGGAGGGAWFINADTRIRRSSFVDNGADYGGGLMVATRASVAVDNSTFSGNEATFRGGAIYHADGNLRVNFSTVAYNRAGPGSLTSGDGGGIWTAGASATDLSNSVLAFNTARTVNGSAFGTVISGNCHGTLDSQGYNTIAWIDGDPDCAAAGFTANDDYNLVPSLGPLETTETGVGYHRLTRINREIDRASPLCTDAFDQPLGTDLLRAPRPKEGDGSDTARCDRGAVEADPVQLHIATTDSGPASWQILLNGDLAPCADIACSYFFIPVGSQITLTADPDPGTTFEGWGGDCSGSAPCTLQMTRSRDVLAQFDAAVQTLNVAVLGGGSVSSQPAGISCGSDCSEAFAQGSTVTLTATPDSGFAFQSWSGDCSGSGSCVVSMSAARSVTASFAPLSADLFSNGFE